MKQNSNFYFLVGDGFKGLPTYAPFDAIYVGAASEGIYFISYKYLFLSYLFCH